MTQEALAAKVYVDARTIRRWEHREHEPQGGVVDRLATAFGIDRDTLLKLAAGLLSLSDVQPEHERRDRHVASVADLEELERIAVMAAVAGGTHAMSFFRSTLRSAAVLNPTANPATVADVAATVAVIRELTAPLEDWTSRRHARFVIFGEELDDRNREARDMIARELAGWGNVLAHDAYSFRQGLEQGRIGVLVDAIDGTGNFVREFPMFCTAVAIFDGLLPSVAAIYHPTDNLVWFGSAPTATIPGRAFTWNVTAGAKGPMTRIPHSHDMLAVSAHLSRTDREVAGRFAPVLAAFTQDPRYQSTTYLLNCGQLSLARVATGAFCAYANPATSVWDIASGEVLIHAMGGRVTDFAGMPIDYGHDRVEVLAAENAEVHQLLRQVLDGAYAGSR